VELLEYPRIAKKLLLGLCNRTVESANFGLFLSRKTAPSWGHLPAKQHNGLQIDPNGDKQLQNTGAYISVAKVLSSVRRVKLTDAQILDYPPTFPQEVLFRLL